MTNTLFDLFEKNKECILEQWLNQRLDVFSQTQTVIKTQMDPFQNPIRHELAVGLKSIVEDFVANTEQTKESLDQISRVLAVQDIPPSKSMSLFYGLREIVRERSRKTGLTLSHKEWGEFNSRIEQLTLEGFNCYMGHREKIYQLKVDESKNKAFMLLKKAGL